MRSNNEIQNVDMAVLLEKLESKRDVVQRDFNDLKKDIANLKAQEVKDHRKYRELKLALEAYNQVITSIKELKQERRVTFEACRDAVLDTRNNRALEIFD